MYLTTILDINEENWRFHSLRKSRKAEEVIGTETILQCGTQLCFLWSFYNYYKW